MKELTASELRKWAEEMEQFFGQSNRPEVLEKAKAHAHRMRARADLLDAESGVDSGVAAIAEVVQTLPIIGRVAISGGRIISIERPYNGEGEEVGIHTAWEWRNDPTAEEKAGRLCRLYVGTEQQGPLAMFDADSNQWHELKSRGNFGKRFACGGTFSSKKTDHKPEIITRLEGIMEKKERIEKAKMRLEAANKRVLAASLMSYAMGSQRQAMNPAYDGQEGICMCNADRYIAHAGKHIAEAELLEAQAS